MPFAGTAFESVTDAARRRAGTWSVRVGQTSPLGRFALAVAAVLLAIPILAVLLLIIALGLAIAVVVGLALWIRVAALRLVDRLRRLRGVDAEGRVNVRVIRRR
jgi:Flp pilus assembly protein TadB